MELWGQKVKTGVLTFMHYKMGTYFCDYDLRSYSNLEFLKEISPTPWFYLFIIIMDLCGSQVKCYYL